MADGDGRLRIRSSIALVDERRTPGGGEAHHDALGGGCGVRGGSVGAVDDGGDLEREGGRG